MPIVLVQILVKVKAIAREFRLHQLTEDQVIERMKVVKAELDKLLKQCEKTEKPKAGKESKEVKKDEEEEEETDK